MFALLLLLALCLGSCLSAATSSGVLEMEQPIIKSLSEQKNDGSYFFAYEGADGSYREEVGIVRRSDNNDHKDDDDDDVELEISGVYRYIDTNGQRVEVSYVADKNGFVPQGTNIPKQITETARNANLTAEDRAVKLS